MTPICPSCGYDLIADEPIASGKWTIDARNAEVRYDGKRIDGLTAMHVGMLHSIAKANGRPLSVDVLAERHSEADDAWAENVIRVQIHRIRVTMIRARVPSPVETVRSRGYRWSGGTSGSLGEGK